MEKLKPLIGYENAGHIKYFAHEHAAKELGDNVRLSFPFFRFPKKIFSHSSPYFYPNHPSFYK